MQVLQYDGRKNKVDRIPVDRLDLKKKKWLNLINPGQEEIARLSKLLGIDKRQLRAAIDEDERPGVMEIDHYLQVTCKYPYQRGQQLMTYSMGLFVSDHLLLTISKYENSAITNVLIKHSLPELFKSGINELFLKVLGAISDEFFVRMDKLDEDIGNLEREVFQSPTEESVRKIYKVKKTLIYFHRAFTSNREAIMSLEKNLPKPAHKTISALYGDTVQLLDMSALYREIMTSTLDIYIGSVSNKLNIIMKRLTAYAALVMVPTFITGLYGMNFRFMPELTWKYGYPVAWAAIVLSVVIMFIYFKKQDWI